VTEQSPIYLQDGATRAVVEAALVEGVGVEQMAAADAAWRPFLQEAVREALARGVPRYELPEHKHWEWERKARAMTPASRAFGIEHDGQMQALMIVRTDKRCRIPGQAGLPLVYVDYLAAAPWNLPGLVTTPRLRKCGRALITAAVLFSYRRGCAGRLGLHSLEQAEAFYRDVCGMADLGLDEAYEGLRYFEMSPAQARASLEG
jgi:hypothetical protein